MKYHQIRHGADPKKSIRAGTLIILPTIALRQWQMEVSRFTKEGTLTVKVHICMFIYMHIYMHVYINKYIYVHAKYIGISRYK
jgi:hypothetical protein